MVHRRSWKSEGNILNLFFDLQEYVMKLEKSHAEQGKALSYCELNLETWRQLWRVLEISDIVLFIADVRYPVCYDRHF